MRLLFVVVLCIIALTGCGDDESTARLSPADPRAQVEIADEVVIELEQNASIGDAWEVVEPPDETVARIVDDAYDADQPVAEGSGGLRVFTLEAVGSGTTTIVIHNCYRCDADGNTPAVDEHEAVDERFEITVR